MATATTTVLATTSGMIFTLNTGVNYKFEFGVLYRSAALTTGIKIGLLFPAATVVSANVTMPTAADAAAGSWHGAITTSGDSVVSSGVEASGTTYLAQVDGTIRTTAAGNLTLQHASEVSASGVLVQAGTYGILTTIP